MTDTKAKPETESAAPKAVSAKSSGGGVGGAITHLLAGGVGGVLALFGVSQFADQIPGLNGNGGTKGAPAAISEALETRLTALESKSTASPKVEIPAELETRIKGLEALKASLTSVTETQGKLAGETTALASQIKALADPAGGGAVELRQRLDSMEGTIASLAKAADGATNTAIPKLAALAGRINDMRTELEAKIAAARQATSGDIDTKLAPLTASLKSTTENKDAMAESMATLEGGAKRISLALETARTESERIAKDVAALRTADEATSKTLDGLKASTTQIADRLTKLESTTTENISALPSQDDISAAITPVTEKLASVEKQIGGIIEREAGRADSAKNVLLSLELANLQRALDQGRPVKAEIENLKKSAPDGMDLSVLDKLASNKVPSQQALVREFSSVASQAVEAEQLGDNASTLDKLLASARSLVRVRQTGDVEGDTTEAVIARAEDNLKRNDLKAAVSELETLKDKAGQAVSGWIAKARDRLSIDDALAKIESSLKSSVSSSATN